MSLAYLLIFTIFPVKTESEKNIQQAGIELIVLGLCTGAVVGATVYATEKQRKAGHEAQDAAKKLALQQRAEQQQLQLQAGEYWEELNLKQMALQQGENRFKTLADLLIQKVKKAKEQGQEILTTPATPAATKELSLIEKINQGIDKFLKG